MSSWARLQAVLLLALLAMSPWGMAQPSQETDVSIEDLQGDEMWTTPDGDDLRQGNFPHADIVQAWISGETVSAFHVGLRLSSWNIPFGYQPSSEVRILAVHFAFLGTAFRVIHDFECNTDAALQSASAEDAAELDWSYVGCVESEIDEQRASIDMVVNKTLLSDALGAAIRQGAALTNIFATVVDRSTLDLASAVTKVPTVVDRAPDAGYGPAFPFRLGLAGSGDIELFSGDPIRVTNGEVGTFVYAVEARNHGDEPATAILVSSGIPNGWTVRHVSSIEIEGRSQVTIPVFLTVLGNHQHGTTATWSLDAVDAQGNSTARLDLGLSYPKIAQPAGHHPTMFLHAMTRSALGTTLVPWMNTIEEDDSPGTTDAAWEGSPRETDPTSGKTRVEWEFPQSPALAMGLDFEHDEEALFHAVFSTEVVVRDASATATLSYCPERTPGTSTCSVPQVLAQGTSAVGDLGPGSATVDVPLTLEDGVDVIEYRKGANLRLLVDLVGVLAPVPFTIRLDIDAARLDLPLKDYHDPVDASFNQASTLAIEPLAATERDANPGDIIVFPFRVSNSGSQVRDIAFGAESAFQEWAAWEDTTDNLAAGAAQEHQFVVRVPDDAAAGTVATFYLIIETSDAPVESLVSRATVTVVDTAVEGDPEPVREPRKSPSVPVALLLLALAMVARRRLAQ